MDCFVAEEKSIRFKPTFGYNSEVKAAERAANAKVSLLESFDSGDATAFWSTWTGSVPPHLISRLAHIGDDSTFRRKSFSDATNITSHATHYAIAVAGRTRP